MATQFDARQTVSRDLLDQLATTANTELDNLLRSINNELTMPLRLSANSPATLVLNIGNITLTNPETSRNHTVPPISNTNITFASGTVTFPAANGGNIVPSIGSNVVLNCPSGQYTRVGISINAASQLTITQGTPGASIAAATAAPTPSNTLPIGFVIVHNTAGTIDNITNAMIYQFGSGGGAGSGSGSGNETLETFKNILVDSPYDLVTPWTAVTDSDQIGGSSGFTFSGSASFSLADSAIKFTAASETATTVQLLDSSEFLSANTDVGQVDIAVEWKAGSIDTAATYQVSRQGDARYDTITMTRVGNGTNMYRGQYQWVREEEDAANSTATAVTTNSQFLTNNAGTRQSVAQKFTVSVASRLLGATAYLSRTASAPTGNYRIAVYNDNAGVPGSVVAAGAFTSAAALTTSAAAYSFTTSQNIAAGSYWVVIETDDTYKAGTTSGNTANVMAVHGDTTTGTNAYRYNFGWVAETTTTWAHTLTKNQEAFDDQISIGAGYAVGNATASTDDLDSGTSRAFLSQAFTTTSALVMKRVQLYLNKVQSSGTLTGNLYVAIYKDSSGSPSSASDGKLGESIAVDVTTFGTGDQTVVFDIPNLPLAAGTYHIVLRSDAAYKSSYSDGVREINWRADFTSPPVVGKRSSDGTTWVALTGNFVHRIDGRVLDLRLKVTSSAGNKLLTAFAAFYNLQTGQVAGGIKKRQVFRFNGNTENLNSFTVTGFNVDSEMLRVFYVEGGQTFVYPAFNTQGQTIVFPVNTFYSPVSNTVTLVFDQNDGSGFDNSNSNAALLAANRLGSTDNGIDKSIPGRGILLRRPDGTLREIVLTNSDTIQILSVP